MISPSIENPPAPSSKDTTRRTLPFITSQWLPLLIFLAIALFAYIYALGRPGLWFDETFSVELARQPLPRLWQAIWGPEPNMELYYLLLHFWLQLTALLGQHPTEFVVRLPSALCAALSVPVVFQFGRRYLGFAGGTLATLLYLFDYSTLVYAQQTRSYALQLLLLCLSWYALAQLYTAPRTHKGWWCLYIATTTLAIYAQLFSFMVLLAQIIATGGIFVLPGSWLANARKNWRLLASAFLLCIVLSLPMVLVSRHGSKTGWLPIPQLHDLLNLLPIMINGSHVFSTLIIVVCLAAVVLISLSFLVKRQPIMLSLGRWNADPAAFLNTQGYLPLLWCLLCWLLIPILVSFVISQGSTRLYSARYLVVIVPALALLIALGVVSLRVRVVQILLTCILLYVTFSTAQMYYPNAQVEDWRTAALWVEQQYQAGDGLICYDNIQGCQTAIEYYFYAYPLSSAHFTSDSPGNLHSWQTDSGFAAPGADATAALSVTAIAQYAQQHPRLFYIVGRVSSNQAAEQVSQAEAWMNSHYHLIGYIQCAGNISVHLYAV